MIYTFCIENLSFTQSDISFFLKVLFSLWKVLWSYLWTLRQCLLHPLPPLPKKKRNPQSISHTSTSWASVYLCKIQFIDPLKCSSKGYHSLSLSLSLSHAHARFTNFNIWGGGLTLERLGNLSMFAVLRFREFVDLEFKTSERCRVQEWGHLPLLPYTTGFWLPLYLPYAWPIVACLSIIDWWTLIFNLMTAGHWSSTKLAIDCQPLLVNKHSRHHHWPLATTCLLSLIICPATTTTTTYC